MARKCRASEFRGVGIGKPLARFGGNLQTGGGPEVQAWTGPAQKPGKTGSGGVDGKENVIRRAAWRGGKGAL